MALGNRYLILPCISKNAECNVIIACYTASAYQAFFVCRIRSQDRKAIIQ